MSASAVARGSGGFTLVEVLMALSIAGLVVLTAHALLAAVAEDAAALRHARLEVERGATAARWLSSLLGGIEVEGNPGEPFTGERGRMLFTTRLLTAGGWHERRRLELRATNGQLVVAHGAPHVLLDSVTVEFDYLIGMGEASPWLPAWSSAVTAPLAIRVRVRSLAERARGSEPVDTLLFAVGRRG